MASAGPLSPDGLGHRGPKGPPGTEDGKAGESLEGRSRYVPSIKGNPGPGYEGKRGGPKTHSPQRPLAGGIQAEEGINVMGSGPGGRNRAAGAAVAQQGSAVAQGARGETA